MQEARRQLRIQGGGGKGAVPPPRILQAFTIFKSYLMLSPRVPISFLTKIQPI